MTRMVLFTKTSHAIFITRYLIRVNKSTSRTAEQCGGKKRGRIKVTRPDTFELCSSRLFRYMFYGQEITSVYPLSPVNAHKRIEMLF